MRPRLGIEKANQVSADLGVLAHPIRLQILNIMAEKGGEVCVCDLEGLLPVKQPTISHHLKLLRKAGVIDCRCHGVWAYYSIRPEALSDLLTRIAGVLERLR
jgi:ArsR family transcriptional regulator